MTMFGNVMKINLICDKPIIMANTYLRIYLHLVFAVKNRNALILPHWKNRVYAYIAQALRDGDHYPIIIGGMPDHVHILLGYSGKEALPDMVRRVKVGCTKFINEQRITPFKFEWQKGYGCFSYSHSHLPQVIKYIENQEQHHSKQSVVAEMKRMLNAFDVVYDESYIFVEPT